MAQTREITRPDDFKSQKDAVVNTGSQVVKVNEY